MPHNEAEIEAQIVAAGKTAPRLTPQHIDDKIEKREFWQPEGTSVTICLITLVNGYTVEGYSASASVENFDKEIGERIAFGNARQKIWPLEGYLLRDRLFLEQEHKKATTGDFAVALEGIIANLKAGTPHDQILREWDRARGNDWFTGTKSHG